jgi:two-component system, sensor histidine kinase and response regulator
MGSTNDTQKQPPPGVATADRTNRSLFATAALLAIASLFACWFGTREIINGIVNYEGREAAIHWAEAFAHTLEDQTTKGSAEQIVPYSRTANPENFKPLDNAIFDGKIVGYRIYNRNATIVASSRFLEIGQKPETENMLTAIADGVTHTHLISPNDKEAVSKAIAPLIWAGDIKGAIQIDVDVSDREAQLNRLRYMAFSALICLLAAFMGTLGFVAARTLQKQKAAQQELTRNIRQHRRLLDEAPDSMVIHNMKRVVYANTAAAVLHGVASPDELIGIDPVTLVPDDKNDLVREHRLQALREGKIMRTESVGRRRLDGSVVETDSMGIPIEWNGESCILIQSRDMSERRTQQRQISEREAQLSAFMEHTQSMMFIKGLDNTMVMANRRYEDFHGVKFADVKGKTCKGWVDYEIAVQFAAHDRQVLASQEPSSTELLVPRSDGELRMMKEEKFPIRNANGEMVGLGCVSSDITEIKDREKISRTAQAEAERAQAQLSAFLDHSPSGMYLKDRNLMVTMVNRSYERFYGLSADELIGNPVSKWLPKHIADEVDTLDLEILRRGEMLDMEIDVENAEGELRTLIFNKFPIYAADGEIVGIGGVNTDVTDARRQEAEVRTTQARLSAYIDHIPMMVMLMSRESQVLMVNGHYEKFFDVDARKMIGKNSDVRFSDEQLDMNMAENQRICDDLETTEKVLPMRNAAGEERLLHQIKFPIVTGGNVPVAIGIIMSDITEQKRHEHDLESARDDAEAANRAKSAFLANMSHEIRTPMNGVFGMADLLAQSELTADQRRYLNTIRRSGEALLGVINNVLDVSRIEAGEFRLDTNSFNLHNLVAEAVELFTESASTKGVLIAHKISTNVPGWVQGDAVRLRQVLINLIGNAIKFTNDGAVVVNAVRIGGTDDDALIRFEITDTGIGIERSKLVNLFDPFNQADSSITRRFGGTGLGLAIADHIVNLMGSRIDIDSQHDEGSSFQFSVPLPIDTSKTAEQDDAGQNLAGKRLLIVDDNAVNREILSEFARDWNADFVATASAVEAQTVLREAMEAARPFDVALIDIVMPDMDGIALAEWIGGQDGLDATKLVALTSFNWDRDSSASRAAGFSRFATKPVRREELARLIEGALAETVDIGPTTETPRETAAPPLSANYGADILLAEDNPVNIELAQEYLTRLGCRVTIAQNGRQAIDRFMDGPVDLILMDVQMPELDGIEATRQIRDIEARKGTGRIPIIAATAHAFQEDREKCILAGMDDFLSKPYTGKDITPLLDRWLEPARTATNGSPGSENNADPISGEMPELLDEETIAQLRAIDTSGEDRIFGKVAGIFLEHTPTQLRQLQKHIASEDFAGISLIAHSLKTSAANVSALSLSDRFRELEAAASGADIESCVDLADDIMVLYDDVSSALRVATAPATIDRKSA